MSNSVKEYANKIWRHLCVGGEMGVRGLMYSYTLTALHTNLWQLFENSFFNAYGKIIEYWEPL